MRNYQVLGLALLAVFAFSAVVSSSALAETTLLAEWLVNGAAFSGTLATTYEGTWLLEDTKAFGTKIAGECMVLFDGTVGPSGEDLTSMVLNLAGTKLIGVKLTGESLEGEVDCKADAGCQENKDIKVWLTRESFPTLMFLMESGTFLDAFLGTPGYEVECLVLGIADSDECTGNTSGEVKNVTGGVEVIFGEAAGTEKGNCTVGGAGAGVIESVGTNLTKTETGTLSVSSE
jgi:hypothetical protein